jgi:hypothetical protein
MCTWAVPLRLTCGATNVLVIVLGETGLGRSGCYCGPIAAPNLDALAGSRLLATGQPEAQGPDRQ